MSTISQKIGAWASGVTFENLSPEAVRMARVILYDSIGCAFGGYRTHDVQMMHEFFHNMGGNPESTVIGCGNKIPALNASLLNSLMVRALDYNDIYWKQDPSCLLYTSDAADE